MSEAKHKYRSTSRVLKETRNKYFRKSNVTIMQKTMVLWDNAHYTQNDNYALYVGALKEKVETRTVVFESKVEYPWSEAKTKHAPELAA